MYAATRGARRRGGLGEAIPWEYTLAGRTAARIASDPAYAEERERFYAAHGGGGYWVGGDFLNPAAWNDPNVEPQWMYDTSAPTTQTYVVTQSVPGSGGGVATSTTYQLTPEQLEQVAIDETATPQANEQRIRELLDSFGTAPTQVYSDTGAERLEDVGYADLYAMAVAGETPGVSPGNITDAYGRPLDLEATGNGGAGGLLGSPVALAGLGLAGLFLLGTTRKRRRRT
jgi:hypothetical protein